LRRLSVSQRISGAATVRAFCRERAEQRHFRSHMINLYERVFEKVRLASADRVAQAMGNQSRSAAPHRTA
jgi:hypothetical protein